MIRTRASFSCLVAMASLLLVQNGARACAVCFGDPDSDLTKGAFAGVLVLFAIIMTVLVGLVGTGLYWNQRSRKLAGLEETQDLLH